MSERLYVVVRADLPIGLQMAQVVHVSLLFAEKYPWAKIGETVVVLHARDEAHLREVEASAEDWAPHALFREPDLGNQCTAAAFDASMKPLLRKLPLAFSPARGSSDATARSEGTGTATSAE